MATYRYDEEKEASGSRESGSSIPSTHDSADEVASFFSINRTESASTKAPLKEKRQSIFHVVSIGEWLNLIVMVKEEESRWHLRRNRLEDDEIREFLHDLAKKLRVARIVSAESLRSLAGEKDRRSPMLSLPCDDVLTWDDEKRVQDFLADLKEVFGLRPISPYMHDSSHSYNFYSSSRPSPRTPVNARALAARRRRLRQSGKLTPMPESAAALFLGPELAALFT